VDGLGHPGAGESLHRQVLDGDRLAVAYQRRGELVVELAPRVSYPGVGAGDLHPG
jgi:hypothetical protein